MRRFTVTCVLLVSATAAFVGTSWRASAAVEIQLIAVR
jgi:hypothetical protein